MREAIDNFRQAVQAALGNAPQLIELGQIHRFPTSTRASDKAGWCKLFLDGTAGVFGDFRTGLTSMWAEKLTKPPTLVQRQQRAYELQLARSEAAAARSAQWSQAAARNAAMWDQASPITAGDPAARYLETRGIYLDTWPEALRYHLGVDYWHDGRLMGWHPVMLGAVTDAAGQLVSLHRTHLTKDGRKANVPVVKKLTGCSARLAGCSVKLYQSAAFLSVQTIGVAEGIETALACFAASGTPTVSAVSGQGMERYQWPEDVKSLIVYADNDISQVGQRAAAALVRRATKAELAARVLTPPQAGTDWADVWAAGEEDQ